MSPTEHPEPSQKPMDDVLRRMLSTPPKPKTNEKPTDKKKPA
jgi:hypothetical protein